MKTKNTTNMSPKRDFIVINPYIKNKERFQITI